MTSTTTATRTFKPDKEITNLLNSLDPEENDLDKITNVTHKCLMVMSVRDASIMKKENENEKIELDELIQIIYLEKLDLMRKEVLK